MIPFDILAKEEQSNLIGKSFIKIKIAIFM